MSLRKIDQQPEIFGNRSVQVYRDTDWDEYVCRLFVDKVLQLESDYHTDSLKDAIKTAEIMAKGSPKIPTWRVMQTTETNEVICVEYDFGSEDIAYHWITDNEKDYPKSKLSVERV